MKAEEYKAHLDILTAVCRTIGMLPIAEMAAHLEQLEALAPVIDPTAYNNGGAKNLQDQSDLIEGAAQVHRAMLRIARRNGVGWQMD